MERHRPGEQNREPRTDIQIHPADFGRGAEAILGMKDSLFEQLVLEQVHIMGQNKGKRIIHKKLTVNGSRT